MSELKKTVIPTAGLGTRFLPLTKSICKNILPLVARPLVSYAVREAKESGIEQIVFVLSENNKEIMDYFKRSPKLEKLLAKTGKKTLLNILKKERDFFETLKFSSSLQPQPKGDGDAVLRAKKQVGKNPFCVMFPDDVFYTKKPALAQLKKVFESSEKTVLGLQKIPAEKLSAYGVVEVEKIANRFFRIKGIIEKPKKEEAPSNLAICGRYVFPYEIFSYLEKTKPNKKGEIILAEAIKKMIQDGKMLYGYEIEGDWLECGKTVDWLKSFLFLALNDAQYGSLLKAFLKEKKIKL